MRVVLMEQYVLSDSVEMHHIADAAILAAVDRLSVAEGERPVVVWPDERAPYTIYSKIDQ